MALTGRMLTGPRALQLCPALKGLNIFNIYILIIIIKTVKVGIICNYFINISIYKKYSYIL